MNHNQEIKELLERPASFKSVFRLNKSFALPFLIAEKTASDNPDLILTLIECDSETEMEFPFKHRPELYVYQLWGNALYAERFVLGSPFKVEVMYSELEFDRDLPVEP